MSQQKPVDRFREEKDATSRDRAVQERLETFFASSIGSNVEKLQNFGKYVPRQSLTRFISRYELFKKVLDVHGSIVECGVLFGGGLMTFAQLSAILEPVNHQRRIIGFDTFEGFRELHEADRKGKSVALQVGGLAVDSHDDILAAAEIYDANRTLGHIPKVRLIRGDVCQTVPQFVKDNPHTVVSLLYLDMDVYQPTKTAIEAFAPRVPRGGIIAFDELNAENWPGETVAVLETLGISRLKIQRFPFDSYLSYAVID